MHLAKLSAPHNKQIVDLSPLAGMPLSYLSLMQTQVSRIDVLRGMPLETLLLSGTKVSDLSSLQGMPLRSLTLDATPVSNIRPLRGLPLESVVLGNTSVSDLSPLTGAPLKELNLSGCKKLTDYTPVLTLARLERLSCDVLPAELLPLRGSKTLQSIDADAYPGEAHTGPRPAAEFWQACDAHAAAQKK